MSFSHSVIPCLLQSRIVKHRVHVQRVMGLTPLCHLPKLVLRRMVEGQVARKGISKVEVRSLQYVVLFTHVWMNITLVLGNEP